MFKITVYDYFYKWFPFEKLFELSCYFSSKQKTNKKNKTNKTSNTIIIMNLIDWAMIQSYPKPCIM